MSPTSGRTEKVYTEKHGARIPNWHHSVSFKSLQRLTLGIGELYTQVFNFANETFVLFLQGDEQLCKGLIAQGHRREGVQVGLTGRRWGHRCVRREIILSVTTRVVLLLPAIGRRQRRVHLAIASICWGRTFFKREKRVILVEGPAAWGTRIGE